MSKPMAEKDEVCWMCHMSSGCDRCCKKCDDGCNVKQLCGLELDRGIARLKSWRKISSEIDHYRERNNKLNVTALRSEASG